VTGGLWRTLLARLFHAVLSIFLLTIIVFGLVRITGDPALLLLPETATDADFDRLHAKLGLDQPLVTQYGIFISQMLHGDFGESISLRASVGDLILQRLPATLKLAASSLAIILFFGIGLGMYSAYWRGGWLDRLTRGGAALAQASPKFWVGLLLVLVFAVQFQVLPSGGDGDLKNLVMPALTTALVETAMLARLLRSSVIDALNTDYVKFLRIKGVPEREILWKHVLRNAGLTSLTFVGVLIASLITGSVVVELVFVWPGIGLLIADSIRARDFPVVQAVVLLFSVVYVGMNLLVDVLYAVLNPRLR
jgi:peptide/nickel transport system permease protein